jgi:inosose dehydratase
MTGASPWDEPLSKHPDLKEREFSAYADKLGEFAIRLKETGIKLAYHHHLKMLVERAEVIHAFCESTREEVGLLLDTGHAYTAGADYAEILRNFGSRVVHIHLKDVRRDTLERASATCLMCSGRLFNALHLLPSPGFASHPNLVAITTFPRNGASASPTSSSFVSRP